MEAERQKRLEAEQGDNERPQSEETRGPSAVNGKFRPFWSRPFFFGRRRTTDLRFAGFTSTCSRRREMKPCGARSSSA